MTYYHMTRISHNSKTGKIPVTTSSSDTCPSTCPFNGNGCYAEGHHMKMHWDKVSNGSRSIDIFELCDSIRSLPPGQLWRHNQAGDLPGIDNDINALELANIVEANIGKQGYTYTHKSMDTLKNRNIVNLANQAGFVINLSANNLDHADELAELDIAPIVVVLADDDVAKVSKTPKGRKILVCPAQTSDNVTCASCKLCANADRNFIIGFKAHGPSASKVRLASNGYLTNKGN